MILHDAVDRLKMVSSGSGCEDGTLMYAPLPGHPVCRFCRGSCMGVEYGGRVAEVSTPEPFAASMRLEYLYDAPLKSPKTRAAAAGALTVTAGFLLMARKLGACTPAFHADCLAELVRYCSGRVVYVIGGDICGLRQALFVEEADLVIVTGDGLLEDGMLAEIEEAAALKKEMLYLGPSCAGIAALLQQPHWCPYGT